MAQFMIWPDENMDTSGEYNIISFFMMPHAGITHLFLSPAVTEVISLRRDSRSNHKDDVDSSGQLPAKTSYE